jgi:hypothetical protein
MPRPTPRVAPVTTAMRPARSGGIHATPLDRKVAGS